jgi:hypothetical protein
MLQIKELNRKGIKKVVEVDISETMACNVGQNSAFRQEKFKNIDISHSNQHQTHK